MQIDSKYLPANVYSYVPTFAYYIVGFTVLCAIMFTTVAIVDDHRHTRGKTDIEAMASAGAFFFMLAIVFGLVYACCPNVCVNTSDINIASDVTITQIGDGHGVGGKIKLSGIEYSDVKDVTYIKDGKIYTNGIIVSNGSHAGLFSDGSKANMKPVLATEGEK